MRGEVAGGITVTRARKKKGGNGKKAAEHQSNVAWAVYGEGQAWPLRMRQEIGNDEANGATMGFSYDGHIYITINGTYAETTIAELTHAAEEAVDKAKAATASTAA